LTRSQREHFALTSDGKIPIELMSFLRIQNLIEDEVDFYGKVLQQQIVTQRNERASVRIFITHLKKLLDSYSTSIEVFSRLFLNCNQQRRMKNCSRRRKFHREQNWRLI
jgi:hypothetical protein